MTTAVARGSQGGGRSAASDGDWAWRAEIGLLEQPRDVHLRDPDAVRDLSLHHVLLEAQAQHRPLALAQARQHPIEVGGLLRAGVARVLGRHELLAHVVVGIRFGPVERVGEMRGRGRAGLQHILARDVARARELVSRRGTPELACQPLTDAVRSQDQLLDVPRHPHRPAEVAEVALELPQDGWHREGRRTRCRASGRSDRRPSPGPSRRPAADRRARPASDTDRPDSQQVACGASRAPRGPRVAARADTARTAAQTPGARAPPSMGARYRREAGHDVRQTRKPPGRERLYAIRPPNSEPKPDPDARAALLNGEALCRHRLSGLYRCGLAIDMDPSRDWSSRRGTFRRDDPTSPSA